MNTCPSSPRVRISCNQVRSAAWEQARQVLPTFCKVPIRAAQCGRASGCAIPSRAARLRVLQSPSVARQAQPVIPRPYREGVFSRSRGLREFLRRYMRVGQHSEDAARAPSVFASLTRPRAARPTRSRPTNDRRARPGSPRLDVHSERPPAQVWWNPAGGWQGTRIRRSIENNGAPPRAGRKREAATPGSSGTAPVPRSRGRRSVNRVTECGEVRRSAAAS